MSWNLVGRARENLSFLGHAEKANIFQSKRLSPSWTIVVWHKTQFIAQLWHFFYLWRIIRKKTWLFPAQGDWKETHSRHNFQLSSHSKRVFENFNIKKLTTKYKKNCALILFIVFQETTLWMKFYYIVLFCMEKFV